MDKSVYPVTLAITDDENVMATVQRIAARFEKLNGVPLHILTRDDVSGMEFKHATYLKAWLWELIPPDVERLFYVDWDIVPVKALEDVDLGVFAAVKTATSGPNFDMYPYLNRTGSFFNGGLFAAHRSTEPLFKQLQPVFEGRKDFGADGQLDQTMLNLMIQPAVEVTWLPTTWNYLLLLRDTVLRDPKMLHFTGCLPGKWRMLSSTLDILEITESVDAAAPACPE